MKPATVELHNALIRLFKGVLTAWNTWLEKVKIEQ